MDKCKANLCIVEQAGTERVDMRGAGNDEGSHHLLAN